MIISNALIANTISLYSLIQTIWGKIATNEAKAAPAPILTRSAGIAQQMSVPELARSVTRELAKPDCVSLKPSLISCLSAKL
jgi:hypothetical protein